MSELDPKKHVAMRSNLASGYSGSSALRSEPSVDKTIQWMGFQARHPDRMTEHDVLTAAISNLGAGGGTVGSVLQAFFYLSLKENPVHLKRLREEIDKASAARTLSRVVSNAEALKLPYLQACVCRLLH